MVLKSWALSSCSVDGDTVFRAALHAVFMKEKVRPGTPLCAKRGELRGLNLACGPNGAVSGRPGEHLPPDFDREDNILQKALVRSGVDHVGHQSTV